MRHVIQFSPIGEKHSEPGGADAAQLVFRLFWVADIPSPLILLHLIATP